MKKVPAHPVRATCHAGPACWTATFDYPIDARWGLCDHLNAEHGHRIDHPGRPKQEDN